MPTKKATSVASETRKYSPIRRRIKLLVKSILQNVLLNKDKRVVLLIH